MPVQGEWTAEAYLWLTRDVRRLVELADGWIEELPMPTDAHQRILGHLGLAGTLLGVDAVLDRTMLGLDLAGEQVAEFVRGRPAQIIVSVIGGQGYIFGRGNQQIGSGVIRAVGRDNIIVVATQRKLASIEGSRLLVDTGDRALDEALQGYIRVRTGPGQSAMMRLSA